MLISSRSRFILLILGVILIGVISIPVFRDKTKGFSRSENVPPQPQTAHPETNRTELPSTGAYPAHLHPLIRTRSELNQSSAPNPGEQRAQVEVCYIDSETRRMISAGTISIRLENAASPLFSAEIEEGGRNYLEMDPGKYKIRVDSSGYGKQDENIEVLSRLDRIKKTIELSRTIAIRGIVRNFIGRPQEGAEVEIFQDGYRATQATGSTGEFEAQLRIQPIIKIIAHHPPHPIAELGPIFWDEKSIPYLQITLPKDADVALLKGKVLDENGKPVKSAAVQVNTNARYSISDKTYLWMEPWLQISQTTSDADGSFSLELPRPCKAWLAVFAEDFEPHRETLQISSDAELKISLSRHPQFAVKVHDREGKEISGITVMGLSPEGKEVVHEASVSGRYYATEYPFTIFGRDFLNNLGFTKGEWINKYREEIILELGQCVVQGKVIDQAGSPVKALNVSVTYQNDETYRNYLLFRMDFPTKFYSEDGVFSLRNLVPGNATITITANAAYGESIPFSQDVLVTEQKTTFLQVVLNKKW